MSTAADTKTVTCRLAQPGEGQVVKDLFAKCYEKPCDWLSWDAVFPHWVLAEVDGIPCGMVMLGVGCPFGWIEFLMIDPSCSRTMKGRIVSALEEAAYVALRAMGVSGAISSVFSTNPSFQRIMTRRGFVPHGTATIYLKRLS